MLNRIHQTICCLLIQPNPDSALNATAGHLLQDDYDSFARQAKLMTSIHARIPFALKEEVMEAKRRGEIADTATGKDAQHSPTAMKGRSASSLSSVVVRKLPERITGTKLVSSNPHQAAEGKGPASEDEDDEAESKENDPAPARSPRQPSKRPLSDLPIIKPENDLTDVSNSSPSGQNVANNVYSSASVNTSDCSRKGLHLIETSQSVNMTGPGLQEMGGNGIDSVGFEGRPSKRICSDSGKENMLENWGAKKLIEKPLPEVSAATKIRVSASRKASASTFLSTSNVKGKSRVGLRRL